MAANPDRKKVETLLTSKFGPLVRIDEGQGGNSWVYSYISDGQTNAIKILCRFDRYDRFKEEVEIATTLSKYDGICPLITSSTPTDINDKSVENLPYFTMPFFEGGSLAGRIDQKRLDNGKEVLDLFRQVVMVTNTMHIDNLAHRDLKPENILIDGAGKLYISDFGLCLDLSKNESDRTTKTQEVVGSFYYRGPEFLRGRLDNSDHRPGDIFALGRILWSLLVGMQPIGLSDWEFAQKKVSVVTSGLKKAYLLDELIANCTEVDPLMRPNCKTILEIIADWEIEPEIGSLAYLSDRILGSTELVKMRKSNTEQNALISTHQKIVEFASNTMRSHNSFILLKKIISAAFPNRSLDIEILPSWSVYLQKIVSTTNQQVASLNFNLGNLSLGPLLIINANFQIVHGESLILFEIAAASVDEKEHLLWWKSEPIKLTNLDASQMVLIEQRINDAMNKITGWLGGTNK